MSGAVSVTEGGSVAPKSERLKDGYPVLGILVDAVDYDEATRRILEAAHGGRPFAVSALAVHGVMTGVLDAEHAYRLNRLDLNVPDGQPVRWVLNLRHGLGLRHRVYGPQLMLNVCERAAADGLPIALYGSTTEVLNRMVGRLKGRFPELNIAFCRPSQFRALSREETEHLACEVRESGARLMFVGIGCPRQETFLYENRGILGMPLLAVGAAFDFHAGTLRQAPALLQRAGLEWAFRLMTEPRRLWRRYFGLNPLFLVGCALQLLRITRFDQPLLGSAPCSPARFG